MADFNPVKLERDPHRGTVSPNIVDYMDPSYFELLPDVQRNLAKKATYISFALPGYKNIQVEDLKKIREDYEKNEEAKKKEASSEVAESADRTPFPIDRPLNDYLSDDERKDIEAENELQSITSLEDTRLQAKIAENMKLKGNLDWPFVESLISHENALIQNAAQHVLLQKDILENEKIDSLKAAERETKIIDLCDRSIEKLKEEEKKFEEESQKKRERAKIVYQKYEMTIESLQERLEPMQERNEFAEIGDLLKQTEEAFEKENGELSQDEKDTIAKKIEGTKRNVSLKKFNVEYKAAQELIAYIKKMTKEEPIQASASPHLGEVQTPSYDTSKNTQQEETTISRAKIEEAEKPIQTGSHGYGNNAYAYYNLNKISEEVSKFNAERQSKVGTKGTISSFEEEKESPKKEEIKVEEPVKIAINPDAYLTKPLQYFEDKKKEIAEDNYITDANKEILLSIVQGQKDSFKWDFFSYLKSMDSQNPEQVSFSLNFYNRKIEEERAKYATKLETSAVPVSTNMSHVNTGIDFASYKNKVLESSGLDADQNQELASYIDGMVQAFEHLPESSQIAQNPEKLSQYVKVIHTAIENKKNKLLMQCQSERGRSL